MLSRRTLTLDSLVHRSLSPNCATLALRWLQPFLQVNFLETNALKTALGLLLTGQATVFGTADLHADSLLAMLVNTPASKCILALICKQPALQQFLWLHILLHLTVTLLKFYLLAHLALELLRKSPRQSPVYR
jgi:hypothetical protein